MRQTGLDAKVLLALLLACLLVRNLEEMEAENCNMWVQWARAISDKQFLQKDDPIYEWRERMFKQYESTIKNSIGYAV